MCKLQIVLNLLLRDPLYYFPPFLPLWILVYQSLVLHLVQGIISNSSSLNSFNYYPYMWFEKFYQVTGALLPICLSILKSTLKARECNSPCWPPLTVIIVRYKYFLKSQMSSIFEHWQLPFCDNFSSTSHNQCIRA